MAASEESPTFFIDELLKGSKIEVGNLFNKLSSWSKEREESQKQLSNIICSYNTIVTQGINDMAEGLRGFSDMQAQLSAVTDERDSLLATVNNLNDEVKKLSDKLVICYKTLNLDHDDDGEARSSKRADRTHFTEPQPGETLNIDVNSEAGSEKRGMWTRLTNDQTKVLQDFLQANAFPKNGDLEYLSEQLNVSCKRIKNWFANARQKTGIKGKRGRPKVEPLNEMQGPGETYHTDVNSDAGSDKKGKRNRLTNDQTKVLQEFFNMNPYPKKGDLESLSEQLNLSCKVIKVWFQNARQKTTSISKYPPPVEPQYEMLESVETYYEETNNVAGSDKRAKRTSLTYDQKKILQEFLHENAFPRKEDLEDLSEQLNVSCKRIKVWFQNARQKTGIKGKRGRPKVETLNEVQEQNNDEEMNHVAGFDKRAKHEMQGSGEDCDDSSDREFIGTEDDIKVETPEIITADTETAAAANTQVDPA